MSGKIHNIGNYIENPPSIFEIIGERTRTRSQKLEAFLKILHNEILPLLGSISETLEKARNRMEDTQKIETHRQNLAEIQDLENEYLWAQIIEFEAHKRAITDLTQKLEIEISTNQTKRDDICNNLSSVHAQYQQKNETVQTEFKKFRALNAELQQLFKDQNQILRKASQIETRLNDPKAKKTPDEIANLEKEQEELHLKEKQTRQDLPKTQKELESQRVLHLQKEKEFRPIKVKYEGMVTEQAKLEQLIKGDNARLNEKQKEFDEISTKIREFSRSNKINLQDRPRTIRTKNILVDKIKILKTNLQPNSGVPSNAKSFLTDPHTLLSSFQKLSTILETFQISEIQNEIHSFSKEIVIFRNQITPQFSNLMNGIGKKGGVQVRSLITNNGVLRFCEKGKENSIASVLTFLLTLYGGKSSQIEIDSNNLSSTQIEDLKGIIKLLQSVTDSDVKISEA